MTLAWQSLSVQQHTQTLRQETHTERRTWRRPRLLLLLLLLEGVMRRRQTAR